MRGNLNEEVEKLYYKANERQIWSCDDISQGWKKLNVQKNLRWTINCKSDVKQLNKKKGVK